MQEDWRQFVPDVQFEKIPIKNLVSNQDYQRKLSLTHVGRTAEHFDIYQINPVKVSRRGGINYVFNGQHTIETVVRASGSRETPVWCMVYDGLQYKIEAGIFGRQQKFVKPLSPYEIFKANIEAGEEIQLTILAVVESYGLVLSTKQAPNNICAVSALEFIYNKYGFHILDRTLYVAISTWEGDSFSLAANMLKGIAKLLVSYGDNLKLEMFVERLSRISEREVTRTAKERRNGSLGFAEVLLQYYNKRTRSPLKWNRLYNSQADGGDFEESEDDPGEDTVANEHLLADNEGEEQFLLDSFINQDAAYDGDES